MLTKTAELIGAALALGGGVYFYKRSKGAPAPPVAPVLPKMPPAASPLAPPTVAQLQASSTPGFLMQGTTGIGLGAGSVAGEGYSPAVNPPDMADPNSALDAALAGL